MLGSVSNSSSGVRFCCEKKREPVSAAEKTLIQKICAELETHVVFQVWVGATLEQHLDAAQALADD
jgi:hypothetical protein